MHASAERRPDISIFELLAIARLPSIEDIALDLRVPSLIEFTPGVIGQYRLRPWDSRKMSGSRAEERKQDEKPQQYASDAPPNFRDQGRERSRHPAQVGARRPKGAVEAPNLEPPKAVEAPKAGEAPGPVESPKLEERSDSSGARKAGAQEELFRDKK